MTIRRWLLLPHLARSTSSFLFAASQNGMRPVFQCNCSPLVLYFALLNVAAINARILLLSTKKLLNQNQARCPLLKYLGFKILKHTKKKWADKRCFYDGCLKWLSVLRWNHRLTCLTNPQDCLNIWWMP